MYIFLKKTLLFLLPIIILHLFTFKYFNYTDGDMLRLGYVFDYFPSYRNNLAKNMDTNIHFTLLSKANKKKYKILTIGDSFSEKEGCFYQNYLSKKYDLLHVDRFISNNQINTLYSLLLGDFFDSYSFDYVILENIERHIVENVVTTDTSKVINLDILNSSISKYNPTSEDLSYKFPSNRVLKFPYFVIKDLIFDDCLLGDVYKTKLSDKYFSCNSHNGYFYCYDMTITPYNNRIKNVQLVNNMLNEISNLLNEKHIKLIFLPSPDKYDIYYDYIVNKNSKPKPILLDSLSRMNNNYIYIDSKRILKQAMKSTKDMYFYDDTHWTFNAAKILSNSISYVIDSIENK